MGNKFRGEALATINGLQMVMVMDFNAMCDMEEATGRTMEEVLTDFEQRRILSKDLRAMAFAMLHERQPKLRLRDVGTLIGEDMDGVMDGCIKAIEAAFPPAAELPKTVQELAGGASAGNPPAAQG
ncbi:hypothetical protein ABEB22_12565 [Thioclava sp. 'Guangxiensis']|uniref:hypothetical protein n=1 Tax=Thioclava sp. 'Guangxiensis' TaxID=3149044 RepID=UPI003877DDD8